MPHPATPRPEASLCLQAQRAGTSNGFACDPRHQGADPTPAEGLPVSRPAPGPSEQASDLPHDKADTFLPVLTEKSPASPPKKASVSPPNCEDGRPVSPSKQASGLPSEKTDSPAPEKASASSPLENTGGSHAFPPGQSGFSPSRSASPNRPVQSTPSGASPPAKSVDPTTSTPCKFDATTDAQPLPELKNKVRGLVEADALSDGEEEQDSWRLPARRSHPSSFSSSTDVASSHESRTASGESQQEGEAVADHSGVQPANMEPEMAADESPLQPTQKVNEAAGSKGDAAIGELPQQPTQEAAAAADESPLQTAQKLPGSTPAISSAASSGAVSGIKYSTRAAATSAAVHTGKSGCPSEAAQAADKSSSPTAVAPKQQVVRILTRPRRPPVFLDIKGNAGAPTPLPPAPPQAQQEASARTAERLHTAASLRSSSTSGCSQRKMPADTSPSEVEKATNRSSPLSEAPSRGPLQKPSRLTEYRGITPGLFRHAPPHQQQTASWQSYRAEYRGITTGLFQRPPHEWHTASYTAHTPYLPPDMQPYGLSSPRSPTSVLPWGSSGMDSPPAKGPQMGMYSKGPGTTGPAAHRALNLPNTTSSHQGKHCLSELMV